MAIEFDSRYNPKKIESRSYELWEQGGLFHAEIERDSTPYTIVIPPPNVTGVLTLGHVLNNTLQDILIRWQRMAGKNAMWLPGMDHAGIATQNVVERKLAEEGLTRHDLGRERFVQRTWEVSNAHASIMREQLRRLGASCDWARERFTLDEGLSRAVAQAFVHLYDKGLIYRDNYIINWCPRCQTVISDEECDHIEITGALYWVRYPLADGTGHLTVATTRPETMLGDTAVAVHPKDDRYKDIVGKRVALPRTDRDIPVIADDYVDPQFGTGVLKITPAHDPNDFEVGRRHELPSVVAIAPDGKMNDNAGAYHGMDRFAARKQIVKDLEAQDLLEKTDKHLHAVAHCSRCDTIIEPYVSLQWFVRMKPLAEPAIKAVEEGRVRFYPERWTGVYFNWMRHIRDWPISRQLWWGHRIPAYYCRKCNETMVSATTINKCSACGSADVEQEADVLDTWFSSWLWPFSTLGWPDQTRELEHFYPTDALVTAPDIIFFWVARMIMAGLEFVGDVPFSDVYLHGVVRDESGRKMSKSLGNSPDPIAVIDEFGADALRFSIILITAQGQDAFYSDQKVAVGRNFCNKVWNASRLVLMDLADRAPQKVPTLSDADLAFADRWILSRLQHCARSATAALEKYQFNEAARAIYEFVWHEYCDWYLEIIKPRLALGDAPTPQQIKDRAVAQAVAVHVLDRWLRLLHPFAPFITEGLWQRLNEAAPNRSLPGSRSVRPTDCLITAPWPEADDALCAPDVDAVMAPIQGIVRGMRSIRRTMNIPERQPVKLLLSVAERDDTSWLRENQPIIERLAHTESVEIGVGLAKPKSCATEVVGGIQMFVPLEGLIDLDKERARLQKRIEAAEQRIEGIERKLQNQDFVARAPQKIVQGEKDKHAALQVDLEALRKNLASLS